MHWASPFASRQVSVAPQLVRVRTKSQMHMTWSLPSQNRFCIGKQPGDAAKSYVFHWAQPAGLQSGSGLSPGAQTAPQTVDNTQWVGDAHASCAIG
jgi:hypothetical protein